jgi:hypothetical protein
VFHSAVLAYVDDPGRAAFEKAVGALERVGHPVCWLANEAPGVVSGTDGFDRDGRTFVLSRDGVPIARTGGHGDTVQWLAS